MVDVQIDVVDSRDREGFGFLIKARESGRLFRVRPVRDPSQPRFWCVMVYRCMPGGAAEPGERPWVGEGGLTRDELPTVLAEMRADIATWLARDQCRELRRWLLTPLAAVKASAGTRAVALNAATSGETVDAR